MSEEIADRRSQRERGDVCPYEYPCKALLLNINANAPHLKGRGAGHKGLRTPLGSALIHVRIRGLRVLGMVSGEQRRPPLNEDPPGCLEQPWLDERETAAPPQTLSRLPGD